MSALFFACIIGAMTSSVPPASLCYSDGTAAGTRKIATKTPVEIVRAKKGMTVVFKEGLDFSMANYNFDGTLNGVINSNFWAVRPILGSGNGYVFATDNSHFIVTDGTVVGTKIDYNPCFIPERVKVTGDHYILKCWFNPGSETYNQFIRINADFTTQRLFDTKPMPNNTSTNDQFISADFGYLSGKILYRQYSPPTGIEVYVYDEATGTSKILRDIYVGPKSSGVATTYPQSTVDYVAVGGKVYFGGLSATGYEMWTTDGTATGTIELPLDSGKQGTIPDLDHLLSLPGGKLVWKGASTDANNSTFQDIARLGITDGTKAGTKRLTLTSDGQTLLTYKFEIFAFKGKVFAQIFDTLNATTRTGLYAVNMTTGALTRIASLVMAENFTAMGGLVYFSGADTCSSGYISCNRELWVTDGTPAGTRLVKDIFPFKDSLGFKLGSNPSLLVSTSPNSAVPHGHPGASPGRRRGEVRGPAGGSEDVRPEGLRQGPGDAPRRRRSGPGRLP